MGIGGGSTGEQVWRAPLRGRVASSPALAGDTVLLTTTRGDLDVLDAATGERRWRISLGSSSESPSLIHISERPRLRRIPHAVFCLKKKRRPPRPPDARTRD